MVAIAEASLGDIGDLKKFLKAKRPYGVLALCDGRCPAFILVRSTTTPYIKSLATSGWQLSKFKSDRKCRLDGFGPISRERFLTKFYKLNETMTLTNVPDVTSLAVSGRLQNGIKYCTKLRKAGPVGQRVE